MTSTPPDPTDGPAVVAAGPVRQQALLEAGALTARALTEATLERVAALDGPLNAFVRVDAAEALAAADRADETRARGGRGALLGIPVAVKNDLDLAGHRTGLGSASVTARTSSDAAVVRRLRDAGAVLVGATTLPELAVYGFTESAAHGTTRNPWDHGRTSGGSSGGSAAAVAAGMVGIATASDGAGSIRLPAACCGLVGFKPTNGLVPSSGGWNGLSTQGCLARSVADVAAFLDTVGDLPDPLSPGALGGSEPLRVGLDLRPFTAALRPQPLDRSVEWAVREVARRLAASGHDVQEVRQRWGAAGQELTVRYLAGIAASAARVQEPRRLERRTRDLVALGRRIPDRVLARAVAAGERRGRRGLADVVVVRDGGEVPVDVDVLLTPTMAGTAPEVGRWAGRRGLPTALAMGAFYAWTPGWNHTGMPAVSVPAGRGPDGLPLAVQLVAARGDDARLLRLAADVAAMPPPLW